MSSRHLVDPQLVPLLESLVPFDLSDAGLAALRAARQEPDSTSGPAEAAADIAISAYVVSAERAASPVRMRLYRPYNAPAALPVLFWLHGGGYVLGSAAEEDAKLCGYVRAYHCAAVAVDYRLAPEHRFPAQLDDSFHAWVWLMHHADRLGFDAARVVIAGTSAGAGLAAALTLACRDRGAALPALQLLIAPMLDDRTAAGGGQQQPFTGEFVWTHAANRYAWRALLGTEPGGADVSPYAAPARSTDLAGLPPTFIAVGALDLFLAEGMAYAARLLQAGVPTELHVYPGAYHGFARVRDADVSRALAGDIQRALSRVFAGNR